MGYIGARLSGRGGGWTVWEREAWSWGKAGGGERATSHESGGCRHRVLSFCNQWVWVLDPLPLPSLAIPPLSFQMDGTRCPRLWLRSPGEQRGAGELGTSRWRRAPLEKGEASPAGQSVQAVGRMNYVPGTSSDFTRPALSAPSAENIGVCPRKTLQNSSKGTESPP